MITKTIIIPCYNEIKTIKIVIDRVKKNINKEDNIVIVDDCSTDNTVTVVEEVIKNNNLNITFEKNSFKKLNFLFDKISSWTQTPIALVISVISIENIMIVNLVAISLLIK